MKASAVAALCAALAAPAFAVELDRGDLRMELGGEVRTLYTLTRALELDDFLVGSTTRSDSWLLLTRLRFDFEAVWRDQLYAEVVYDVEGRTGTGLDTVRFEVAKEIGTLTWLDWDRSFSDHSDFYGQHLIYRAWLRYERERSDLTIGRQRSPLGRARLWNPTDLFNPIFPLAIEGDQRIGVDSLVARWEPFDEFWGVVLWAPQDDPDEHKGAFRLEVVRPQIDAALMVGSFARDWVFGFDFARNLGDAAIRGETTFTHPDRGHRFWQAVFSIDYTFPIGNGLYALAEHLYNENLLPSDPALIPLAPSVVEIALQQTGRLDRITTIARHQTALELGYEFNPLVRTDLLGIYDWNGESVAFFPVLRLALYDDLIFSLGAQLFLGQGGTEYGDAANLYFAQLDLYF